MMMTACRVRAKHSTRLYLPTSIPLELRVDVLVYGPFALWKPHLETELEIIEGHLLGGDQVTFLGCDGDLETCEPNREHKRSRCLKCIGRREAGLAMMPSPVASLRLADSLASEDEARVLALPKRFPDLEAIRALKLDAFDLGMASLSSLFGIIRDVTLDVDEHADWIGKTIRSAARSYLACRRYLTEHRPDLVYLFNGRIAVLRPMLRACQELGIDCDVHERGRTVQHYQLTRNVMSHEIGPAHERYAAAWEESGHTLEEREAIADAWYRERAKGHIGSWYSYIEDQKESVLPDDWDASRRNVAVYPSTEYEYAAISDEWANPVFANASEGIHRTMQTCLERDPNLHFSVRMHPNESARNSSSVRYLRAIDLPNTTLIAPDSEVSTYALLHACDLVFVTGSTVGVEASYLGKPVILAGRSPWVNLGAAYTPDSFDELVDLLCNPELPPCDREGAIRYAYYMATFSIPFERFEADGVMDGKYKGRRVEPTWTYRTRARLARLLAPLRLKG
jgi:hypothetical protein